MNKILFDMDGTLYSFENGDYKGSRLERQVEENALKLLHTLEQNTDPNKKFLQIKKDYLENFSIAFEEIYGITKERYFEIVWDINPEGFIFNDGIALPLFEFLKSKGFDIYIVSEAPFIWIQRVINFLRVDNIISGIFSGQGNERKSNGLLYERIANEIGNNHFMVGDQLLPDIIMAREKGFLPIYLNGSGEKSDKAVHNIIKLEEIYNLI